MRKNTYLYLSIILIIAGFTLTFSNIDATGFEKEESIHNPADKAENTESIEAFDKMMSVIAHKRCVNCHPAGNRPHQGEDSHLHRFEIQRGDDNHGIAALKCSTCHQDENNNFSGVPGAPEWSLAPIEMAWEGLSKVEIARSMTNPKINGGRSLEETVEHLTEHALVLWAFDPGVDHEGTPREKPPISKEEYIAAVKEWAENGAVIPEK